MKTHFTTRFKKHYKKRIQPHPNVDKRFEQRYLLFLKDRFNPILKDHPFKGKKRTVRAFSITGNIRVTYYLKDDTTYFLDIGTHNQVY